MRIIVAATVIASVGLAGCSKAPDTADTGPALGNTTSAGLAFTYDYSLTLPARAIDDLQEAHAAACEQLGASRCRITGMRYLVDKAGDVSASLSLRVATPLARRFGREAITAAERAGATLTGAQIGGSEAAAEESAAIDRSGDARTDVARIDDQLRRTDLPAAERTELQAQRAMRLADLRTAASARTDAGASIATAPISFDYTTGRGSGFVNQLRDAGDTALASAAVTLTSVLWLLAVVGPPALGLLVLLVLWLWVGRRLWARVQRIGTPHAPAE